MSTLTFSIGAPIYCEDGAVGGKLTHVVAHADRYHVTDLILARGLPLFSREARVVPITAVSGATENEIVLSLPGDALASCAVYEETFLAVEESSVDAELMFNETSGGYCNAQLGPPIRQHFHRERAEPHVMLGYETKVRTLFEFVGSVECLLVDQKSLEITHVVVGKGTIRVDYLLIPVEMIGEIGEEEILLVLSHGELADLPRYLV